MATHPSILAWIIPRTEEAERLSLSFPVVRASQVALVVKNPPAKAGDIRDACSIPGSGRSSGGGHGNPPQYSCLENPHGQRSLWAMVHRVNKESDTTKAN